MYEFTMGGSWFRWSLLDRTSKQLAAGSLAASIAAVAPATLSLGSHAYDFGYRLGYRAGGGSGKLTAPEVVSFSPVEACWLIAFSILSAFLWWRFSLRQDELFNRVQNWALGMAGAWSATLFSIWAVLDLGGLVAPVSPWAIIAIFYISICAFWLAGVRRWV